MLFLQRSLQQSQGMGGQTTVRRAVSGTASSVAFTPLQGLEIVSPQAVEKKVEDAKYFSSTAGFLKVKKQWLKITGPDDGDQTELLCSFYSRTEVGHSFKFRWEYKFCFFWLMVEANGALFLITTQLFKIVYYFFIHAKDPSTIQIDCSKWSFGKPFLNSSWKKLRWLTVPFNNMQTLKLNPTNVFFAAVNQVFGGSS